MFKKQDMVVACSCNPRIRGREEQTLGLPGQPANLVCFVSGRAVRDLVLKIRWTVDEASEINLWPPRYTYIHTHMHLHE